MSGAGFESLADELLVTLKVDELHPGQPAPQPIAISLPQRRTRDDQVASLGMRLFHKRPDRSQPGSAVMVIQWNARALLDLVRWRMKIVAVMEFPAQKLGKPHADGAFAAPRNSHDNDDHDAS